MTLASYLLASLCWLIDGGVLMEPRRGLMDQQKLGWGPEIWGFPKEVLYPKSRSFDHDLV